MKRKILPNLKTTHEKYLQDVKKYNYYKEVSEIEGEYSNLRNEYYEFLLNLLLDVNSIFTMPYRGAGKVNIIDISRSYSTSDKNIISYVENFLLSNKIGKINSVTQGPKDLKYYYILEIKCEFLEFFNAIYGEIQWMEYFDKTEEEAKKEYEEFVENNISLKRKK